MKRTIVTAAIAAALVFAPRAQAQISSPIHVGVSGGISFPTADAIDLGSDYKAQLKSGYNVNGVLAFQVPLLPVGLRAEVGYDKFDGKNTDLGSFGSAKSDVGVLSGTLNLLLQPTGLIIVKPYAIGGVGAYRVKTDGASDFLGTSATGSASKTSFGLNGGVGVRFGLGGLSTFLEARYHYVLNKESCENDASDSCLPRKNTSFVPVSFGVMF